MKICPECKKQGLKSKVYPKYVSMLLDITRGRVLDVGCGIGDEVAILTSHGVDCTGLDINIDRKPDIRGNGYSLPFRDESFDTVMSFEFLEHVDIDRALREQIRVLKTGGRLVIEQANLFDPLYLLHLSKSPINWIRFFLNKESEDIHSRLWWRRKLRQYPLKIVEFTSYMGKIKGGVFKPLSAVIGNILIVAIKEG